MLRAPMGDAYTPGLTVTASAVVRKTRRLPLPGTVLVKAGDRVEADQVIARTMLPGKVHLINLANHLGVPADEIESVLVKKPGDTLRKGELIAERRTFFGLFRSTYESPLDGAFESVSSITGQAVLRHDPTPVEVKAYVDGTVVEIIEDEGAIIEARAAMVQGIFGLAGEAHAPLAVVAKSPGEPLEPSQITKDHAGKIIVGGGAASLAALERAVEVGAAGVVVGGFAYQDVKELLGYDVGVAVTGTEELGTTLIVTEGFGDIAMARATFELLQANDGRGASISGATQIRAGVIRPEVVIPTSQAEQADEAVALGLDVGAPVRCIRAPHFGRIGEVVGLPVELMTMPSETRVRVVEVRLDGAETVTVPRANVEVIER
jgi:biotin carboxyl carrier protein